ncbi:MAG: site-2 protease family protein [Micrococcales bacterium]|nr:site-2 protease family protein [Micrococcales bacterium]
MGNVLMYVVGVVILVVGVLVSIGLHEIGHMVPAKKFGVRVSQYMVGFGPTIWSKTKGETEYGLKWIPLGGYVRLVGMYPTDEAVGAKKPTTWWGRTAADARAASAEEIHEGEDHRAFYRLSTPKKLVVMFGGPVMNLLLAVVLMGIVMVGIGVPTQTTTIASVEDCILVGEQTKCPAAAVPAPAKTAGLQPGDVIVSWDGHKADSWADVRGAIRGSSTVPGVGKEVQVVIERDGRLMTLPITVEPVCRDKSGKVVSCESEAVVCSDRSGKKVKCTSSGATKAAGYAGIVSAERTQRKPVWEVPTTVGSMVWQVGDIVAHLPQRVWDVADRTINGEGRGEESVLSIVGVGRIAGDTTSVDASADSLVSGPTDRIRMLLGVLAALNISLFVFNLIPLPPLDGGHITAALWEGARRQVSRLRGQVRTRPADSARLVPVGYAMFVLLLAMGVMLIWADIVNPVKFT